MCYDGELLVFDVTFRPNSFTVRSVMKELTRGGNADAGLEIIVQQNFQAYCYFYFVLLQQYWQLNGAAMVFEMQRVPVSMAYGRHISGACSSHAHRLKGSRGVGPVEGLPGTTALP